MKCPVCAEPIDLALERCDGCGAPLLDAFEKQAFASQVDRAAAQARKRRPRRRWSRAALSRGLFAAAFACFVFAWALYEGGPPGRDVPTEALDAGAFACVPPRGWVMAPVQPVGRWKPALRLTRGADAIEVLEAPASLARSARSAQGAFLALLAAFEGSTPRLESQTFVDVDGLRAVRLEASGPRQPLPSPNAGAVRGGSQAAPAVEQLEFRGLLVLVPASGRTLAVRVASDKDSLKRLAPLLEGFLANFRVRARPSSFRRL